LQPFAVLFKIHVKFTGGEMWNEIVFSVLFIITLQIEKISLKFNKNLYSFEIFLNISILIPS
jgi:hypothetical protein